MRSRDPDAAKASGLRRFPPGPFAALDWDEPTPAPLPPMPSLADAPAVPPASSPDAVPDPYDRDFPVPNGTPCTEEEFLTRYNDQGGVEYVDGRIDYLPVPSRRHQRIAAFLYDLLRDHFRGPGRRPDAEVNFAGLRVRTPGRFRDPDVTVLLDRDDPRAHNSHFDYADLCVEVVSPDDPQRDLLEKRREYAAAGVPEYWIVDPRDDQRTVTVLRLTDGEYRGEPVGDGETVQSALLPGLSFAVTDCLNAR